MRILYFSRGYSSHDHRFLEGLSRTEHDVHYLRLDPASGLEKRPLPDRITAVSWGEHISWIGDRVRRIREIVHDLQPDVIHAGPVQACAFPASMARSHPLVTMSWGSDILVDAQRGIDKWKARYALKRSAIFLCDCNAVRLRAIELGVPDERIVVFPWGVNLDHFIPGDGHELRKELGWEKTFIVLSSRSFEPIYGVDTLVRGWIVAAQRNPKLRLLLLGSGSQERILRQMLEQAGMLERAHFSGQVRFEELPGFLQAADLYVSASHSDGSSISLLEAMACGLPALVSDIPGNREWVQPDVNGWWFEDGDSGMLADRMGDVIDLGAELHACGHHSRTVALERANWRHNFQRLLEAYHLAHANQPGHF